MKYGEQNDAPDECEQSVMLRVDLHRSLCRIRRQRTVWVDTRQWPATQVCHHVIDCTYLLLDGRRSIWTLH